MREEFSRLPCTTCSSERVGPQVGRRRLSQWTPWGTWGGGPAWRSIRSARAEDVADILALIKELAEYEKLSAAVVATEARLREHLFGPDPVCEALVAEVEEHIKGVRVSVEGEDGSDDEAVSAKEKEP